MRIYSSVVRARWALPVVLTVVGALIGLLGAVVTPRTYAAQSELYFAANAGQSITELNDATYLIGSQITSYAQLATSRSVLDPVAREVQWTGSLAKLADQVDVTVPLGTVVLKIEAKGPSPDEAAALANAVAKHVSEQVSVISPQSAPDTSVVRAALITQAVASSDASSPSRRVFAGTGGFLGLLVGSALAAAVPVGARRRRSTDEDHEDRTDPAAAPT